nr:DUF4225 domain-containing protein [uncultured Moellerella sp.]
MSNDGSAYHAVERKLDEIVIIIHSMAKNTINNSKLSFNFIDGVMNEANKTHAEYRNKIISYDEAYKLLNDQLYRLQNMELDIFMGKYKFFAIIERTRNSETVFTLKNIGFIGGGSQNIGDYGICYASIAAAAGPYGTPQLLKNLEELRAESCYLVYHEDPRIIPLKSVCREIARIMVGNGPHGDILYSTGELMTALSSGYLNTSKPDPWKLFRYTYDDFIINWANIDPLNIASELITHSPNAFTIYKLQNEIKK